MRKTSRWCVLQRQETGWADCLFSTCLPAHLVGGVMPAGSISLCRSSRRRCASRCLGRVGKHREVRRSSKGCDPFDLTVSCSNPDRCDAAACSGPKHRAAHAGEPTTPCSVCVAWEDRPLKYYVTTFGGACSSPLDVLQRHQPERGRGGASQDGVMLAEYYGAVVLHKRTVQVRPCSLITLRRAGLLHLLRRRAMHVCAGNVPHSVVLEPASSPGL